MRKLLILLSVSILLLACTHDEVIRESRIAMGTAVTLTFYDKRDAEVADEAFSLLYEIENKISFHESSSYISKINDNAGISPVVVPDDVYMLIKDSMELARRTDYYFNPLMGAVTSMWNIGSEYARVPGKDEIEKATKLLSIDDIALDDDSHTVYLKKVGMKLDLGGIGKGYAAECLKRLFLDRGIKRALINLGGNVYALGEKKDGSSFRIGIQNPEGGEYLTVVDLQNECAVTSGGYERYSIIDGVKYHHIFSSDGYPSESDLLSATIISSDSMVADALSTAVFSAGSSIAEELAKSFGVRIITYSKDKELRAFEP